jgi:BirA family biotin operon repressor/biotin-[acetyl-CoA-carboxylase] ligase
MRRLKGGDPGRLWISAANQTAGRGRRGRAWTTPSGNLSVSLALVLSISPGEAATLGFVAGLALGTTLHYVLPELAVRMAPGGADSGGQQGEPLGRVAVKWPNDVTFGGRKLSGILLEAEPLGDGRLGVVIGIGVNVVEAPEGLPYPVASLKDFGFQVTADTILDKLIEVWPGLYVVWLEDGGFAKIRAGWLGFAQGLGQPVAVSLGSRVIRGTFETIDETGRLIVRDDSDVRHAIAAGDVHFGVAATARPED